MVEEEELGLDSPLLAQVSRWDALKDPLGVLAAFAEHVHAEGEPHLLLAGPDVRAVADDPEGAAVFAQAEAAWHALPPDVRRRVHLALLPMEDAEENAVIVNALQRRAACRSEEPRRGLRARRSRRRCGRAGPWWRRRSAGSRTRSRTVARASWSSRATSPPSASG